MPNRTNARTRNLRAVGALNLPRRGSLPTWSHQPRQQQHEGGEGGGTDAGAGSGTGAGAADDKGKDSDEGKGGEPGRHPGEDQLGDGGKAAIKAERTRATEAEKRAEAAEKRANELEATHGTASERALRKAAEDAAKATRDELTAAGNARLVRAELKAAAGAAGFHDTADALTLLGAKLAEVKVTDEGDVDEAAVKALVADLVKSRPYLVKGSGVTGSDVGLGAGAAGSTGGAPDGVKGVGRMRHAYSNTGTGNRRT